MQLISQYFNHHCDHDRDDHDVALHVNDVFEPEDIDNILHARKNFRYFVPDHYTYIDRNIIPYSQFDVFCLPAWLERTMTLWHQSEFDSEQLDTQYCFNFAANKKTLNRYLMIKLIEIFALKDYDYTWSGNGREFNLASVIEQLDGMGDFPILDSDQRAQLLSPIMILEKFLISNIDIGKPAQIPGESFWRVGSYRSGWDHGLRSLFENSAVSLITESHTMNRACMFSEKTLHSVFGLTFPIWIGGYRQALEWERLGYDSFSDVIDHSYQECDTLIERCYRAFELNLPMLTDRDLAHQHRVQHLERLVANRNLVLSDHLRNFNNALAESAPTDLRPALKDLLELFRKLKSS